MSKDAKIEIEPLPSTSPFSARDLVGALSLATKPKPHRAFDAWLVAQLSGDTQTALANYQGQDSDTEPLQKALLQDLNMILTRDSIYELRRFSGINLRLETKGLMSKLPKGTDLERLNWLLIKDAYETAGRITTLSDFLKDSRELQLKANQRIYYRGESKKSHDLLPSIGRKHSFGGMEIKRFEPNQEKNLLHRFRRNYYAHSGKAISEWEALLLARHYGLPTRLLDWSASALASLFFACENNPHEDGQLWGMVARDQDKHWDIFTLIKDENTSISKNKILGALSGALHRHADHSLKVIGKLPADSQTDEFVKIIYPILNSPRIVAQGGIFTWHSNPYRALNVDYINVVFKDDNLDIKNLYRWIIPWKQKRELLESLDNCGINKKSLFPDLDGLAINLCRTEVLFFGEKSVPAQRKCPKCDAVLPL